VIAECAGFSGHLTYSGHPEVIRIRRRMSIAGSKWGFSRRKNPFSRKQPQAVIQSITLHRLFECLAPLIPAELREQKYVYMACCILSHADRYRGSGLLCNCRGSDSGMLIYNRALAKHIEGGFTTA
jgi:hypothetical protein